MERNFSNMVKTGARIMGGDGQRAFQELQLDEAKKASEAPSLDPSKFAVPKQVDPELMAMKPMAGTNAVPAKRIEPGTNPDLRQPGTMEKAFIDYLQPVKDYFSKPKKETK